MCSGGGGSRATIVMPKTSAYNSQADMQIELMKQQQQGLLTLKQMELNQSLQAQQQVLTDVRDFRVERANDTAANATRMAALMGAPPPEPTAKPPVIGTDRESMVKPKGKRGLRVDRVSQGSSTSQGTGAGLNITMT